jgi:hypothetical protein
MTSCLDSALCVSLFLHTYPYINKAFHFLNTQKFYICKLMKDYDSQRRSEVFDVRGGEAQWLLLTEIMNLPQKFIFFIFSFKISILQPEVAATAPPPLPQRSR